MSREELARLRQCCKMATPEECILLMQYCQEVDSFIADDMYLYLRADMSYDKLSTLRYIPTSRMSFYNRCDNVLERFREYLYEQGRWA